MGMFATGVTVVATEHDGEVHGMTANAFSSVSLAPPLVLVCLNRGAKMESLLQQGQKFTINFLSEEQEALSRHFAGGYGLTEQPDFSFRSFCDAPSLDGAICTVACEAHQLYDGGDHVILVGKVNGITEADEQLDPLLFWKGRYHALEKVRAN